MGHIDDSFLMGYEYTACKRNVQDNVEAFQKLGFVIHPVKSVFIPTQEIEFLVVFFFIEQHPYDN